MGCGASCVLFDVVSAVSVWSGVVYAVACCCADMTMVGWAVVLCGQHSTAAERRRDHETAADCTQPRNGVGAL